MTEKTWKIILHELDFRYSRSSGPGGQHVNKTESKVEIRWNITHSKAVSEAERNQLFQQLKSIIKGDGFLIVTSEEYRSREQNRLACLDKLQKIIKKGLHVPKKRIKTKPTKSSIIKRIEAKKNRGRLKKSRQNASSNKD